MTPIQKAKEICLSFLRYITFEHVDSIDKRFNDWASTPEAAALLSGEDWISVKDRLPEPSDFLDSKKYLILLAGKHHKLACYMKGSKKSLYDENKVDGFRNYNPSEGGYKQFKNVTHWQPLPEPPKP